jgi:hypothetical protein
MIGELWRLGTLDLAGRIAAKEPSSREVIDAHVARIEAVNPAGQRRHRDPEGRGDGRSGGR